LTLQKLVEKPEQWALYQLVPLPQWTVGRVTLLGDSAHASVPYNGGGAGQAIEDAYVLGELLSLQECDKKTLPRFLRAYEDARRPRATAQQLHAIESGNLMRLAGEYGADFERIGTDLHTRFHWIWKHDLRVDVEAAKARLRDEGIIRS
jgi:salicylate hydroxylase